MNQAENTNQPAEAGHIEVSLKLVSVEVTLAQDQRQKEVEELIAKLEQDYSIDPSKNNHFLIFIN